MSALAFAHVAEAVFRAPRGLAVRRALMCATGLGLLALVGGVGLTAEPGTSTWWLLRPVWLIGLAIILVALTIALSPIERMTRRLEPHALPRWQAVVSGIATCLGFAQLALHGIHAEGPLGFRLVPITLIVFGAVLAIAAIPKSPGRPA